MKKSYIKSIVSDVFYIIVTNLLLTYIMHEVYVGKRFKVMAAGQYMCLFIVIVYECLVWLLGNKYTDNVDKHIIYKFMVESIFNKSFAILFVETLLLIIFVR